MSDLGGQLIVLDRPLQRLTHSYFKNARSRTDRQHNIRITTLFQTDVQALLIPRKKIRKLDQWFNNRMREDKMV